LVSFCFDAFGRAGLLRAENAVEHRFELFEEGCRPAGAAGVGLLANPIAGVFVPLRAIV